MQIDQLLFGYEDGHRQLAGSVQLSREGASLLLGATDATVTSAANTLITGLPLKSEKKFVLSMTWLAPEIDRPGAVWGHALIIGFDELARLRQPASLLAYLRRPESTDFSTYSEKLTVDPLAQVPVRGEERLLSRILDAATEEGSNGVVTHSDLDLAKDSLLLVWSAQWPALRRTFSFRTRETVRLQQVPSYIAVARKIRGMHQPPTSSNKSGDLRGWVARFLDDPDRPGALFRFLSEFGPDEPPRMHSLIFLGELYELVAHQKAKAVAASLQRARPEMLSAQTLKGGLFGKEASEWWSISELELLSVILATRTSTFDPVSLDLAARLKAQIRSGHLAKLVTSRARSGPKRIRASLLEALVAEASTDDYLVVAQLDSQLARDLLRARDDFLRDTKFWEKLSDKEADDILSAHAPNGEMIVAATQGGHFRSLLRSFSFPQLLGRLIERGQLKLLRQTIQALGHELRGVDRQSRFEAALILAAAGIPPASDDLIGALEESRCPPNITWLKAAVFALATATGEDTKPVLMTVFGPLHHAITDDRLPRELWNTLNRKLPKASDPSLRLRKLLLRELRKGEWSPEELAKALRDSGPHIDQLRKEAGKDDDLIRKVLSA